MFWNLVALWRHGRINWGFFLQENSFATVTQSLSEVVCAFLIWVSESWDLIHQWLLSWNIVFNKAAIIFRIIKSNRIGFIIVVWKFLLRPLHNVVSFLGSVICQILLFFLGYIAVFVNILSLFWYQCSDVSLFSWVILKFQVRLLLMFLAICSCRRTNLVSIDSYQLLFLQIWNMWFKGICCLDIYMLSTCFLIYFASLVHHFECSFNVDLHTEDAFHWKDNWVAMQPLHQIKLCTYFFLSQMDNRKDTGHIECWVSSKFTLLLQ